LDVIIKPLYASWAILEHDLSAYQDKPEIFNSISPDVINHYGVLVSEHTNENLITNVGKNLDFDRLFGFGLAAINALGAGASATAAAISDTRLTYELIGNASRKTLTNTSGAALSNADIVAETITISSVTYTQKLVVQAVYGTGDGNNGQPFQEYALFNTTTNPATPTSTSGVMLNHFIDGSSILKSGSNTITVQTTLRL